MKYFMLLLLIAGCATSQTTDQHAHRRTESMLTGQSVINETYYTPEGEIIKTVEKKVDVTENTRDIIDAQTEVEDTPPQFVITLRNISIIIILIGAGLLAYKIYKEVIK